MIIITDTIEYTEKVLGQKFIWKRHCDKELPQVIQSLLKRLFDKPGVFYSYLPSKAPWKYIFIVDHAVQSQYSVLIELLKNASFPDGIACLAQTGQNFKGYRHRSWQSVRGNLHLSLFLNPSVIVPNFNIGFTILSTISVVEALYTINGLSERPAIKWVNDIYIKNCKVSGVLNTYSNSR